MGLEEFLEVLEIALGEVFGDDDEGAFVFAEQFEGVLQPADAGDVFVVEGAFLAVVGHFDPFSEGDAIDTVGFFVLFELPDREPGAHFREENAVGQNHTQVEILSDPMLVFLLSALFQQNLRDC